MLVIMEAPTLRLWSSCRMPMQGPVSQLGASPSFLWQEKQLHRRQKLKINKACLSLRWARGSSKQANCIALPSEHLTYPEHRLLRKPGYTSQTWGLKLWTSELLVWVILVWVLIVPVANSMLFKWVHEVSVQGYLTCKKGDRLQ